jgi:hypothetical protein
MVSEFQGFRGETLLKDPDTIRGTPFKIYDLENCTVYLMDRSRTLSVSDVWNSRLFLGPVSENCYLQDCHDCTISVACKQFTAKNLTSCTVFLFCSTKPVLESCSGLKIGSYNYAYPHQDQHFIGARLDISKNLRKNPICLEGDFCWTELPLDSYYEERKELLGYTQSVNPLNTEGQTTWYVEDEAAANKQLTLQHTKPPVAEYQGLPIGERSSIGDLLDISLDSDQSRFGTSAEPLMVLYSHPLGYVSEQALSSEVSKCLEVLSAEAVKAHTALATLFITAHCIILGALLWLLLAVVLKLIEDWYDGAWGVCLTLIVAAALVCGGICLWKYRQTYQEADNSINKLSKSCTAAGYSIDCSLAVATIRRLSQ